jgi:hypothetical protein
MIINENFLEAFQLRRQFHLVTLAALIWTPATLSQTHIDIDRLKAQLRQTSKAIAPLTCIKPRPNEQPIPPAIPKPPLPAAASSLFPRAGHLEP